jgi:hypothetical protein
MYSPKLGRFVNRDPIDYKDGWGLYSAYFTPNMLDPSGKETYVILVRDGQHEGDEDTPPIVPVPTNGGSAVFVDGDSEKMLGTNIDLPPVWLTP